MTILVGVDGSPGSIAALRFALAEAELRGSDVQVLHAWQVPVTDTAIAAPGIPAPLVREDNDELRRQAEEGARRVLEQSLEEVREAVGTVSIRGDVAAGPAGPVLVTAARRAELLVVGRSGHGGVVALLLGSVSRECAERAACPVAVIPLPFEPE